MKNLSIDFRLLVGEDILTVNEIFKEPQRLIDYYCEDENPPDTTFQGGYCITIDGKKWNLSRADFYFDIFALTLNWLHGLEKLLSDGATETEVAFWQESTATVTLLSKNNLEIMDITASGRVRAQPVVVDFKLFCELIIAATRDYERLAQLMKVRLEVDQSIRPDVVTRIVRGMCGDEFHLAANKLTASMKTYFQPQ